METTTPPTIASGDSSMPYPMHRLHCKTTLLQRVTHNVIMSNGAHQHLVHHIPKAGLPRFTNQLIIWETKHIFLLKRAPCQSRLLTWDNIRLGEGSRWRTNNAKFWLHDSNAPCLWKLAYLVVVNVIKVTFHITIKTGPNLLFCYYRCGHTNGPYNICTWHCHNKKFRIHKSVTA